VATKPAKTTTKVMGLDLGVQLDERVLRWWIIIVVEFSVAGLISMLVIIPQVQSIKKINDELVKQQKMAADLTYKAELLSNFSLELNSYESVITSVYPTKKDTGLILLNLRKMVQENKVDLRSYTIRDSFTQSTAKGKSAQKSNQAVLYVELTVDGAASDIKRLLENINNSLPLKHVEDFQVIKSLAKTGGGQGPEDRAEIVQAKLVYSSPFMPYDLTVDSQKPITAFTDSQQEMIEKFKQFKNYFEILQTQSVPAGSGTTNNPDWTFQE
jgi:hypothetical protein